MKRVSRWKACGVLAALILTRAAIATAQDDSEHKTPRMDVFALFSVPHDNGSVSASTTPGNVSPGWLYGFDGGFATDVTKWLDVVAELSVLGGHRTVVSGGDPAATRQYAQTLLFVGGPQFTLRRYRLLQPFVRGLVGGSHRHITPYDGNVGFAAGAGGGLDVALSPRLAVRAIQYDFLAHTGPGGWTDYHRIAFGFVLRFRDGQESDDAITR